MRRQVFGTAVAAVALTTSLVVAGALHTPAPHAAAEVGTAGAPPAAVAVHPAAGAQPRPAPAAAAGHPAQPSVGSSVGSSVGEGHVTHGTQDAAADDHGDDHTSARHAVDTHTHADAHTHTHADTDTDTHADTDTDAHAATAPAPSSGATATPTAPGADASPTPVEPVVPTVPAARPAPAPGVVTGTLVRLWAEVLEGAHDETAHAGHGPDEPAHQTWLETADGTGYRLPDGAVRDLPDGAEVTAHLGAQHEVGGPHALVRVLDHTVPRVAAGEVAFGEGSTDLFGVAAATLEHDVTVVLAHPTGGSSDTTTATTLANAVNGGANTYWSNQSRGQRGFRVARSVGWTTFSKPCSDPFGVWSEIAAKVGWTAGSRKHLLLYIPPANGCGAGLGTVGSNPDVGGRSWVGYTSTSIIAHELGHNLGLGHANGLLCTDRSDGTWSTAWQAGCTDHEYRNYYDVMGVSWSQLGSLAAPNADALGLLRSTERLVTSEPVRVRLVPQTSDGLRVLRIDEGTASYYVEYRVATGWDSWLASNTKGLDAGVVVTRRHPTDARKSLLLDGSVTAGTRTADWAAALRPGTTFTSASGRTTVSLEQQSSTGVTVVVMRDGVGPAAVTKPAGGRQVELRSPTVQAASSGATVFSGVATAPEGTLQWEVLQGGAVRASGSAASGSNGTFDAFQVPVALPAGTYTFRVWVPDDSDGEGTVDPALLGDETTITIG